jgi:hypothetical protein
MIGRPLLALVLAAALLAGCRDRERSAAAAASSGQPVSLVPHRITLAYGIPVGTDILFEGTKAGEVREEDDAHVADVSLPTTTFLESPSLALAARLPSLRPAEHPAVFVYAPSGAPRVTVGKLELAGKPAGQSYSLFGLSCPEGRTVTIDGNEAGTLSGGEADKTSYFLVAAAPKLPRRRTGSASCPATRRSTRGNPSIVWRAPSTSG